MILKMMLDLQELCQELDVRHSLLQEACMGYIVVEAAEAKSV